MPQSEAEPKPAQINVVQALALLLGCQLAGEILVTMIRLLSPVAAFPGPVAGMALLFLILAVRGGAGPSLNTTAGVILANLSLLFVPAAVGVVRQTDALLAYGPLLFGAILVSTVLTLLATVAVFVLAQRWMGLGDDA